MKKNNRVGERYKNTFGSWCTVIEYNNAKDIIVRFDTGFITKTVTSRLIDGKTKDFLFPTVYGMGYMGDGAYRCEINGKKLKAYNDWAGILYRCYDRKFHIKRPTYKGCSIVDEWLNYQSFAKWHSEQKREDGWMLDKDVIVKNNKVYSPETCCFLPLELNCIFGNHNSARGPYKIGVVMRGRKYSAYVSVDAKRIQLGSFDTEEEAFNVHKAAKEENIRRVTEKYKGIIDDRAYESLMNYSL